MCKSIFYYDHSPDAINVVKENLPECIDVVDDVSNLYCKQFSIAHIGKDNDWDTLIANSKENDVRLRVSTQGRPTMERFLKEIDQKTHFCTEKGVYCLFLYRPHHELEKEEWEEIGKAITDLGVVKKIVEGNIPPDLSRYFGEPPQGEILALAILCQGYLAAWAGNLGRPANGSGLKVLQQMGLSPSADTKEGIDELIKKAGEKFKSVQKKAWWKVFNGKVSEKIKDEAEAFGVAEREIENILELTAWIDGKNGGEEIKPEVVAKAYLDIDQIKGRLVS